MFKQKLFCYVLDQKSGEGLHKEGETGEGAREGEEGSEGACEDQGAREGEEKGNFVYCCYFLFLVVAL